MATFHDRTNAPKFQRGLLRSAGSPCRVLTSAEVVDLLGSDDTPTPTGVVPPHETHLAAIEALLPAEPDTAAQARALHARRALVQAAEHGVALLAALGLPRLVTVGFSHSEPAAIGDALDVVIAHLDALDVPAEDLEETGDAEPSLGWTPHIYQTALNIGDTADIELDMVDWEDGDPAEETSLETFGRGFVRCGADDDEDGFDIEEQHDAEQTYEDGSEDEPYPWRCDPSLVTFAVQVAHG